LILNCTASRYTNICLLYETVQVLQLHQCYLDIGSCVSTMSNISWLYRLDYRFNVIFSRDDDNAYAMHSRCIDDSDFESEV